MPPVPVYVNEDGEEISVFNTLSSTSDDSRKKRLAVSKKVSEI
jgi:hypothetical protein